MRRWLILGGLCLLTTATAVLAQVGDPRLTLDYRSLSLLVPETPGVSGGAVAGLINPAAWRVSALGRPELAFFGDNGTGFSTKRYNWGVASSGLFGPGAVGLGVYNQWFQAADRVRQVTNWQLGVAMGDRDGYLGLAYRWATGAEEVLGRENSWVAGLLLQPYRYVSFGASGAWSTASRAAQGVFDVGLRPLGTPLFTVYSDYTLDQGAKFGDGRWGLGVALRPTAGLRLGVTAREAADGGGPQWGMHVGLTFDDFTAVDVVAGDDSQLGVVTSLNPPTRGMRLPPLLDRDRKEPTYAVVDLENKTVTYQKYRWGDDRRVAWLDLVRHLEAIARDPDVAGVMLNLADTTYRPSLAWELRTMLARLQAQGKKVIVYANRLDFLRYYVASVADRIVLDPEGAVVLQGVAMRRTFEKEMLAKVGIGFQPMKYFTYKSAMDVFARADLDSADRGQRQRMVDVIYETVRDGVCASRHLDAARFDALVNQDLGFWPQLARERGLVDDIGRWRDMLESVRDSEHRSTGGPSPACYPHAYPEAHWSAPTRIAVVYAVGPCAMDSGIHGRATARFLRGLKHDPGVAAVVLRADSPGGDVLPSDLVAGAVRELRAAGKPVVVSQGDVAASGGYWISMDGERILTTPLTITGSIGVIAGWFWNDGIGDKVGLTTDGVQRGDHADLLTGLRFPLIGSMLPARPLDGQELELARGYILQSYDDFVRKVATGRGLDEARVRAIAQGHVWMGEDALARGLCDQVGTLTDAIALARHEAGVPDDREVTLQEYPPRPLVDLAALLGTGGALPSFPFGLLGPLPVPAWLSRAQPATTEPGAPRDYVQEYLNALAEQPGRGMAVTPPDALPAAWTAIR